jgi:hypothetical protein
MAREDAVHVGHVVIMQVVISAARCGPSRSE